MGEDSSDTDRIFRTEARRRAARIGALTQSGVPKRGSEERAELWRHAHSLKGTAGSLGHERIERLAARVADPLAPNAPSIETNSDLADVIAQLQRALAELDQP